MRLLYLNRTRWACKHLLICNDVIITAIQLKTVSIGPLVASRLLLPLVVQILLFELVGLGEVHLGVDQWLPRTVAVLLTMRLHLESLVGV